MKKIHGLPGYGPDDNPYDKDEYCQCGKTRRRVGSRIDHKHREWCRWCEGDEAPEREDIEDFNDCRDEQPRRQMNEWLRRNR